MISNLIWWFTKIDLQYFHLCGDLPWKCLGHSTWEWYLSNYLVTQRENITSTKISIKLSQATEGLIICTHLCTFHSIFEWNKIVNIIIHNFMKNFSRYIKVGSVFIGILRPRYVPLKKYVYKDYLIDCQINTFSGFIGTSANRRVPFWSGCKLCT